MIVKLWPGKSEAQKQRLADSITHVVTDILHYGEESVSVSIEEISADDWRARVYEPDILSKPDGLYKKPGYTM